MNILIIDDERPALELLKETLIRIGRGKDEIVLFKSVQNFQMYADKACFDIAFIDIELGTVSGIQFALELKKYSPKCNIIFVTSYDKYGAEAFKARPSGYVLKPYSDEDIRAELDNLRYPQVGVGEGEAPKLKVVTFGNFIVYKKDGQLLDFTLTRSKELFAYLIDNAGYAVTTSDIARDLFEKDLDKQISKNLSKIITSLMDDLKHAGFSDVVIKQNRQLMINKSRVDCDLYNALKGDIFAINAYYGEYMIDYSWAEITDSTNRLASVSTVYN